MALIIIPLIQTFSMSESRNKLDLNNLLAKYQTGSLERSYSANYLTPSRVYHNQPVKQSRYISVANNYHQAHIPAPMPSVPENFQMSKSECQQFLIKIREELKKQSKGLKYCSENAMKQVHQNFQKQHQMIKREILALLEKAFQENERIIREQLRKQGQVEPQQFLQVHRKIAGFDEGIQRLIHNLKTQDYRKAIAEVVLKDFNSQLYQLREIARQAKDDYYSNLGGTQINRAKIECIRNDLGSLFTINKKSSSSSSSNPVINMFANNVLKDKPSPSNQSRVNTYKFSDNTSEKENPRQREQQKKSFFNFLM